MSEPSASIYHIQSHEHYDFLQTTCLRTWKTFCCNVFTVIFMITEEMCGRSQGGRVVGAPRAGSGGALTRPKHVLRAQCRSRGQWAVRRGPFSRLPLLPPSPHRLPRRRRHRPVLVDEVSRCVYPPQPACTRSLGTHVAAEPGVPGRPQRVIPRTLN